MVKSLRWVERQLEVLDQLQLPYVQKYIPVRNAEDGWRVIKEMRVRGAPAIAIVAMLSLAADLNEQIVTGRLPDDSQQVTDYIVEKLDYLVTSRPTAVNLSEAANRSKGRVETKGRENTPGKGVAETFISAAEDLLKQDVLDNHRLGENGERWILDHTGLGTEKRPVSILTHCNTG